MTSNRPYLIRAIYEWIIDNELTPYILIDTTYQGAQLPAEYIEDGKIILNISPEACRGLHLDNDRIIFTAKFGGSSFQIYLPPGSVLAIYAKENGKGMIFNEVSLSDKNIPKEPITSLPKRKELPTRKNSKPTLKIIK